MKKVYCVDDDALFTDYCDSYFTLISSKQVKILLCTYTFLLVLYLCASAGAIAAAPNLSEQQLLEFADRKYEKEKLSLTKVRLGRINDFTVVVDYICSDLCPNHTVRVIHFELPPDKVCAEIGGIEEAITIPYGIGTVNKIFCVPKVLAGLQNDMAK